MLFLIDIVSLFDCFGVATFTELPFSCDLELFVGILKNGTFPSVLVGRNGLGVRLLLDDVDFSKYVEFETDFSVEMLVLD